MDHLTSPGLAYSQILLARIYEPLVLVNTVISWIRLADLNPFTCTMYISLTIFLFRSGIVFNFHLLSTIQITVRPKKKNVCVYGHISKKSRQLFYFFYFFFFLLSAKPEIVVPGSGIRFRYFIFEISGKLSFVEAVFYDELHSFSTFFALNFDKKLAVE